MEIKHYRLESEPYLSTLRGITGAPRSIYISGSLPVERYHTVAIVGTRKPTSYGREVSYDLAYKLAKKGIIIVSGLAYGIDAVVHRAALDAGGITIAVLANGLDSIYPAAHQGLAREIVEKGGAIISEYPAGTGGQKYQFLARNRLISGLADAIIVTEATDRSGTSSTVSHALDQNREVFAVPGPITSPQSVGPNRLIQQGAHPLLSADSVFEVIAPELLTRQVSLALGDNPLESQILQLIYSGVRDGDALQKEVGIETSEFLSCLSILEINGRLRPLGGNRWAIVN